MFLAVLSVVCWLLSPPLRMTTVSAPLHSLSALCSQQRRITAVRPPRALLYYCCTQRSSSMQAQHTATVSRAIDLSVPLSSPNRASYRLSRLLSTVMSQSASSTHSVTANSSSSTTSSANGVLVPLTDAQSRALAGTCEEWRPNIASVLLTADAIDAKVRQLAAAINERYAGRRVLCVGLLTGAFVFLADLVRHLTIPYQVDFMVVSSYGQSVNQHNSGAVTMR